MDPLATTPDRAGTTGDAAADETAGDRLAPRLRSLPGAPDDGTPLGTTGRWAVISRP